MLRDSECSSLGSARAWAPGTSLSVKLQIWDVYTDQNPESSRDPGVLALPVGYPCVFIFRDTIPLHRWGTKLGGPLVGSFCWCICNLITGEI
jgi:hypothetical protein